MADRARGAPLCPSAQPAWEGSVAFGVVQGSATEPRLHHLERPLPVTPDLLAAASPVRPTEVFRFAAPCLNRECRHFGGGRCHLAAKITATLPAVTPEAPDCDIRPSCRWWLQEGRDACLRCPQVVTDDTLPSAAMVAAADPRTRAA